MSFKKKITSLTHTLQKKVTRIDKKPCSHPSRFTFFDVGFHGDRYLLQFVDCILSRCGYFIETGTNVGSTCAYVARTYPRIQCFSCEPELQAFQNAVKNTAGLENVSLYNETSQKFLKHLGQQYTHVFEEHVLFWLDAHGYGFTWPLKEEVAFITTHFKAAYILIDDFKVPELDCFNYDAHQEQECSFEYIKDALKPELEYHLYYPNYTEKTSPHHPLLGWGLLEYGHNKTLNLPVYLQDKIRQAL